MARQPAPPGPPPPNYRPPGTPRPLPGALTPTPAPRPSTSGVSPAAATAFAVLTLLLGLVAGFFLGRAYDDGDDVSASTTGTIAPSPTAPPARPPGNTIPQQPPGAPPATDLTPGSLGAFDDPIPVGQAYVLGLYEIEVLGVTRDATDALTRFAPANPPPPSGEQHVLIELAIRFTDPTGLGSPGAIPFFVSDGEGQWNSFESRCGLVPGDLRDAGFIEAGDEAVGQVCFTVPGGAVDALALGTESFSGPLWFALP